MTISRGIKLPRQQEGANDATDPDDEIDPNGEIVGQLVDELGKPVAGMTVVAGAIINDSSKRGGAKTVTDAAGRYRLKMPSPGIYSVYVRHLKTEPQEVARMTAIADNGVLVEAGKVSASRMVWMDGIQVDGTLVDEQGQPVPDTTVYCYSTAKPQTTAEVVTVKSDDQGRFEFWLPPGRAHLYSSKRLSESADNPDGVSLHADAMIVVPLNGEASAQAPPLKLVLATSKPKPLGDPEWTQYTTPGTQVVRQEDASGVSGTVVDVDGKPIAGAKVFRYDGPIDAANEQGEFQVTAPRGTQFILYAFHPGYDAWWGTPAAGDVLKIVLEKKQLPVVGAGGDKGAGAHQPPLYVSAAKAAVAPVDAEAVARQLAADRISLAKASDELAKLVASREQSRQAGGDTDRRNVDIAVQRVRVAQLKLRIAEAENLTRPGSTPDDAVQTLKRETLVRWGTPVNGVQIGLERVSIQDTYAAGEAVEFRRRVRNVGAEVLETTLQFRPGANVKIELYSDGRFTASFAGATEKTVAIKLQPGADEPIAGSEFRIETKSIQPGRYFVEAYDGFRIGDPPDAKQQVVASSPNWRHIPSDLPLAFDVVAANAPVPAESKPFVLKGGPEIAWGEPVQGLQAGVRYVRVKNRAGRERDRRLAAGRAFHRAVEPSRLQRSSELAMEDRRNGRRRDRRPQCVVRANAADVRGHEGRRACGTHPSRTLGAGFRDDRAAPAAAHEIPRRVARRT